jgi:hypothetical protein
MHAMALLNAWRDHWEGLGSNDSDADAITNALDADRAAVVASLRSLR